MKDLSKVAAFNYLALGVSGGVDEGNLNAHLFAPAGNNDFVCVDAGCLYSGLSEANRQDKLEDKLCSQPPGQMTIEGRFLHENIKAYLITHTFLDHLQGLVQVSPNDSPKPLLSLPETIDALRDHVFNWTTWPNFGNEGVEPQLNLYEYKRLETLCKSSIPGSDLTVEAHSLCRSAPVDSAAYLLEHKGQYIVFFGDTGPDCLQERSSIHNVWTRIAPLIKERRVRAVFLECSYPDSQADDKLFSHMKPYYFMETFRNLGKLVDPKTPENALSGLKVVVTHIKPHFLAGESARSLVERQLRERNTLELDLHIAKQGMSMEL